MSLSDGIEPGPDGSLPRFDEVHYLYCAPVMEHEEAEGDYYLSLAIISSGTKRPNLLIPSGWKETS